jgi:hypothetical protein
MGQFRGKIGPMKSPTELHVLRFVEFGSSFRAKTSDVRAALLPLELSTTAKNAALRRLGGEKSTMRDGATVSECWKHVRVRAEPLPADGLPAIHGIASTATSGAIVDESSPIAVWSLEQLLTNPDAFALETASPLQRAICRIADGLALRELAQVPEVRAAIGEVEDYMPRMPAELVILSGIRTGKSLLAAALAVRAALTCDLSKLRPGEVARVSVLSLTVDLGRVVFGHIYGTVSSSKLLSPLKMAEQADSVMLRHPSGRDVEIKVVAGARAGASLVARWSAGCIFDEAPRMQGEEDGIVNYDDARRAVLGRLLPGAQLVAIGSPWAPRGPIYEAVKEHAGKPTAQLVVVRAPAPAMNPVWWTPERVERLRLQDETAYRTDVLGEFSDPETALISTAELDRATRKGDLVLGRVPGLDYVAAMDPGTRGNAWTLVVVTRMRREGRALSVCVLARQWQGSKSDPLDPDKVLGEVALELKAYGLRDVWTDQLAADFVRSIGLRHDLGVCPEVTTARSKNEMFESMRMRLADSGLEIPDDPTVRADLLSIRKRVATSGGFTIELPRTADGRHADYAPALALACSRGMREPPEEVRTLTVDEQIRADTAAAFDRVRERQAPPMPGYDAQADAQAYISALTDAGETW